ncbi:MAG: LysR family transcriptional regulator [Peptococcaceae bacterium]|jgi:LysR family hydrogen peroxide-inducible transcriptional activator|nr:LysR family transcriptional regulator [Peptococcaceae bacterium]MDH7525754.1 LysR family transcriptional regulator [Peptococcaceae bacterium]
MEIHQLEYVLALQKYMQFSLAAEEINISQPTLSHGIKKLEQELGVNLFTRNTRNVQLTPAGEEFVVYAKRILSEIDKAKNAMLAHANLDKGNIKVGAIPTITYLGITSVIAAFQKTYPGINMEISEEDTDVLIKKMHASELDAAFLNSTNISHDELEFYPLINDKLVLLVSASHELARQKNVNLADLSAEKFMVVTGLRNDFVNSCRLAGFEPNIVLVSIQALTVKELVEEGLGIAPFTTRIAEFFSSPRTAIVNFTPEIKRTIALTVAKHNKTITTQAFKDFILKNFRKI